MRGRRRSSRLGLGLGHGPSLGRSDGPFGAALCSPVIGAGSSDRSCTVLAGNAWEKKKQQAGPWTGSWAWSGAQ
ncbi:hypothetical protein F0562_035479 [Nyssa sinensis]|uniref:Uncharacterized protein n=1 Tax=Nyssa sinensis TaxID=561372 RepID=A0A5J5ACH3_9ASTE|nr:hypothetical protein F0562_035479 [Nyssa sinensis]